MDFEKSQPAASETTPSSKDPVQAERLDLASYLKMHKEIVLSAEDEEMTLELRKELMARAGEAICDGKTLDYVDKNGNWAKVPLDFSQISVGTRPETIRDEFGAKGFKMVSAGQFFGVGKDSLIGAWEAKKKRLSQERASPEKKCGFDF